MCNKHTRTHIICSSYIIIWPVCVTCTMYVVSEFYLCFRLRISSFLCSPHIGDSICTCHKLNDIHQLDCTYILPILQHAYMGVIFVTHIYACYNYLHVVTYCMCACLTTSKFQPTQVFL